MAWLTLLRRGAAAAARKAAPRLELLEDASGTRALAFGVQWRSIATTGGRDEALKLARQAGASHYLYRGQQLGLGVLPRDTPAALRVYPAACVAARHMVGNAICALRIQEREYWIAALANGAPTSTDLFLQGIDDGQALQRVHEIAREVHAGAQEAPTLYTNIEGGAIEGARSCSDEDLFQALASGSDLLQPLPAAGMSLPRPVLATGVLIAMLLAAQQAYQGWARRTARASALSAASDEPDPAQAWSEAIARWRAGKAAADGRLLLQARDQLNALPLRWQGWILTAAVCRASPAALPKDAAQRSWSCLAQYGRGHGAVVNRNVAAMLPAGWTASFTPLHGMDVSWHFMQPVQPLDLQQLPPAEFFRVEVASRLQPLLPALAADVSYRFMPVEISAPRRKDGTAMPVPPQAQGIEAATLTVKAPMRNIDALIQADVSADWTEIRLSFDDHDPKGELRASSVMAEAKGEMYARH
ncbi:hypothetical protein [Ramlibacter sp. AN1133]|uniref:hypothetical protein n=1 Tax=Ramlibacter sp. AN1133 TaxID=3133429 RepID=UPI0030C098F3